MTKTAVIPLPGLAFYEVWASAMRVRGVPIGDFCKRHGKTYQMIRFQATGATNGPEAALMRAKMIDEVGEDLFLRLYQERMRALGGLG